MIISAIITLLWHELSLHCYYIKNNYFTVIWKTPHGAMAKVLDCKIVVSKFKLQLCFYIHFWTYTLGKGMNPLITSAMG